MPTFGTESHNFPATAGTQVQLTCPTGTQPGDLLVAFVSNNISALYTVPSGWKLVTQPASNSTDVGSGCFYRIADGTDVGGTTTYTFVRSGTATAQGIGGAILRLTGVDTAQLTTSWPAARAGSMTAGAHTTTASTTPFTSGTPTNPATIGSNDLLVRAYITGEDAASGTLSISGTPTGWTERVRGASATGTSSFDTAMLVITKAPASDTATVTGSKAGMWDIYTLSIPGVQSGAVSMAGAGSMSLGANLGQFGALSMAGAGSLSLNAQRGTNNFLLLDGAGHLTLNEVRETAEQLTMAGAGALTVSGGVIKIGQLDLSGAGALSINGIVTELVFLAGVGTANFDGHNSTFPTIQLSGEGTLFANAVIVFPKPVVGDGQTLLVVLAGQSSMVAGIACAGAGVTEEIALAGPSELPTINA